MKSIADWRWTLGLVLAAACGGDGSSGPNPGPEPGPEPPPGGVTVRDNFYQPAAVTVTRVGGVAEVSWSWAGSNLHNVTFDAGPPNSATQTSGSFSRSFSESGAFTYFCTVHGRAVMSGTVNVD
jgi:plastocyanin